MPVRIKTKNTSFYTRIQVFWFVWLRELSPFPKTNNLFILYCRQGYSHKQGLMDCEGVISSLFLFSNFLKDNFQLWFFNNFYIKKLLLANVGRTNPTFSRSWKHSTVTLVMLVYLRGCHIGCGLHATYKIMNNGFNLNLLWKKKCLYIFHKLASLA